ncbi:tRNA-dihydrouridine synthase, partial [bacterium]|nr:tRNA-dihydrouridine synthase [bacterium]
MALLEKDTLILAPMTGILNLGLRLAFRRCGWKIACIGAVDAHAVAARNDGILINVLGREEHTNNDDRPVIIQLIGNDADALIGAMSILEEKADIFDINLGCPLKIATSKGQGAALLQQPEKTLTLVE